MISRKEFYFDEYNTTVEVAASFRKEKYGADADGNRWEYRYFLDDYDFTVPLRSDTGKKLSKRKRSELEKLVQDQCDEHIWDI